MTALLKLSASLEDYLEAIFHIAEEKGAAKVRDLTRRLEVKSASVTGAMKLLSERGLVNYAPYEVITLTPVGKRIAKDIIRRHEALSSFFTDVLDIDEAEAELSACDMEHAMSPQILERLIEYLKFVKTCPAVDSRWIEGKGFYCASAKSDKECSQCNDKEDDS